MAAKFFRYQYALKKRERQPGSVFKAMNSAKPTSARVMATKFFRYPYALKKENVNRDRSSKR